MRLAGRITEWNDEKGFGFVIPNGGGTRAFIHISCFRAGSRRPMAGDLISYLPVVDARGRTNAQQLRHAGLYNQTSPPSSRMWRAAFGCGALSMAAIACVMHLVPPIVLSIYVGMSALSYLLYWGDKSAAQARGSRQRTPENQLHLADLLGGWPGALIALQQFRHKTAKHSFQNVFWATMLVNLMGCLWLVKSGLAAELT